MSGQPKKRISKAHSEEKYPSRLQYRCRRSIDCRVLQGARCNNVTGEFRPPISASGTFTPTPSPAAIVAALRTSLNGWLCIVLRVVYFCKPRSLGEAVSSTTPRLEISETHRFKTYRSPFVSFRSPTCTTPLRMGSLTRKSLN